MSATAAETDGLLMRLGHVRATLVLPLARASSSLVSRHAWCEFGYRNQEDYARERLRRGGRWLRDLAALHECFERFPMLALASTGMDGQPTLGRKVALALGRAATEADIEARIRQQRGAGAESAESRSASQADSVAKARTPTETDTLNESHTTNEKHGTSETHTTEGSHTTVVGVEMPPEIRVALDEVLDLHRAVSGHQVGFGSLVEALVADAMASGWHAPEAKHAPRRRVLQRVERGRAATPSGAVQGSQEAASHTARSAVPAGTQRGADSQIPAVRRAHKLLGRYADITRRVAGVTEFLGSRLESDESRSVAFSTHRPSQRPQLRALERAVRELLRIEDEIEMRIAELLVVLSEDRAWRPLGFDRLADYAQERLGLSRAAAHRRVRLARGLRGLAHVRDAYESGQIGAQAATWVVRHARGHIGVPSRDTQRAWIEHARTTTLKRLDDDERCVRHADLLRRAAITSGTGDPSGGTRPREADCSDAHRVPTDEEWHASLFRKPGLTRAHVGALGHTVLEKVVARAALAPVRWRVVVDATLAHQFLACTHAAAWSLRLRAEACESQTAAEDARLGPVQRIARTYVERGQPVPAWVGLLALLEEYTRTWDDPVGMPRSASDKICHRDGARCMAPGCTARRNLQVHHTKYRAHGGGNELTNLVLLCAFHHQRGEHGGLASCRGTAPLGLTWRLGKPELATWFRNERRIDASGL